MPMTMQAGEPAFSEARAEKTGKSLGGGIRSLLDSGNDTKKAAIEAATQYAQSGEGYADDPQTFAAKIAGIIGKAGGTPGPVMNLLMSHKEKDWTIRQKKTEEDAKRAESQKRATSLVDVMAPETTPTNTDWVPTQPEAQRTDERAKLSRLAEVAPEEFSKAAVTDQFRPQKNEVPPGATFDKGWMWDAQQGKAVKIPGYEPSAADTPKGAEEKALDLYGTLAAKEATGEPLTPKETAMMRVLHVKFGLEPKAAPPKEAPKPMQDAAGNLWYPQPDGSLKMQNPQGWQGKETTPKTPVAIQGETGVTFVNPEVGKTVPYPGGPKRAPKSDSITDPVMSENLDRTARAILAGQVPPDFFSMRGNTRQAIVNKILEIQPGADITGLIAGAGVRKKTEQGVRLLSSLVEPKDGKPALTDQLLAAYDKLGFGNAPAANAVRRMVLEQTGSGAIKEFDNLRNSLIFEAGNALAGGSPTDQRIKLELENWPKNPSRKQVESAAKALKEISAARKSAYQDKGAQGGGTVPGAIPPEAIRKLQASVPADGQWHINSANGRSFFKDKAGRLFEGVNGKAVPIGGQ